MKINKLFLLIFIGIVFVESKSIYDTSNWSKLTSKISTCIYYDFTNNEYYDFNPLYNVDGGHEIINAVSPLPGITRNTKIIFNLCGLASKCKTPDQSACYSDDIQYGGLVAYSTDPKFTHVISDSENYVELRFTSSVCSTGLLYKLICDPFEESLFITSTTKCLITIKTKYACKRTGVFFNNGKVYDLRPLVSQTAFQSTNGNKDLIFNLFGNSQNCATLDGGTNIYQACLLTVKNKLKPFNDNSRYDLTQGVLNVGSSSEAKTINFNLQDQIITIKISSLSSQCSTSNGRYYTSFMLICDPFKEYYIDSLETSPSSSSNCSNVVKIYTKYACPTLRLYDKSNQFYDLSPLQLPKSRYYNAKHFSGSKTFSILFNIGNEVQECNNYFKEETNGYFACQLDHLGTNMNKVANSNLGQKVTFDYNKVTLEYKAETPGFCTRSLVLILKCEALTHFQIISSIETSTCVYTIIINTKYVCSSTVYSNLLQSSYYDLTVLSKVQRSITIEGFSSGNIQVYYAISAIAQQCQGNPALDFSACNSLGNQIGSVSNHSSSESKNGLIMSYTSVPDLNNLCFGRNQRVLNINIECDKTIEYTQLGSKKESFNNWACLYDIYAYSKYACPSTSSPLLSSVKPALLPSRNFLNLNNPNLENHLNGKFYDSSRENFYDISALKRLNTLSYSYTSKTKTYYYNLFGTTSKCNNLEGNQMVQSCYIDSNIEYQSCLLTNYDQSFIDNGITIAYYSSYASECSAYGNAYKFEIELACDPSQEYQVVSFTENNKCQIKFHIKTKHACAIKTMYIVGGMVYDVRALVLSLANPFSTSMSASNQDYDIYFNIFNTCSYCQSRFGSTFTYGTIVSKSSSSLIITPINIKPTISFPLFNNIYYMAISFGTILRLEIRCNTNEEFKYIDLKKPSSTFILSVESKYACSSYQLFKSGSSSGYNMFPLIGKSYSLYNKETDDTIYYSIGSSSSISNGNCGTSSTQSCIKSSQSIIKSNIGSFEQNQIVTNSSNGIIIKYYGKTENSIFDNPPLLNDLYSYDYSSFILDIKCDPNQEYVHESFKVYNSKYITVNSVSKHACLKVYQPPSTISNILPDSCVFTCTPLKPFDKSNLNQVLQSVGVCPSELSTYNIQSLLVNRWVSSSIENDFTSGQIYKNLIKSTVPPNIIVSKYITVNSSNSCTYSSGLNKGSNTLLDYLYVTGDLAAITYNSLFRIRYTDDPRLVVYYKPYSSQYGLAILQFNYKLCYFEETTRVAIDSSKFYINCPFYQLPQVTGISPSSGFFGETIKLFGSGFNSKSYDVYFSSSAGIQISNIITVTDNVLIVSIPNGKGSGQVYLQNVGGAQTAKIPFTFNEKVIDNIIIQEFETPIVNRFYVIGSGFGSLSISYIIKPFIVETNELIHCEIESSCNKSSTSIIEGLPSYSSVTNRPCLYQNLYSSNKDLFDNISKDIYVCIKKSLGIGKGTIKIPETGITVEYSYMKPYFYEFSDLFIPTDGRYLTIYCENFPPTKEMIDRGLETDPNSIIWSNSAVYYNDIEIQNVIWQSSTLVKVLMPPGIGTGSLRFKVGNQFASGSYSIMYGVPSLSRPITLGSTDGGEIMFSGSNFVPTSFANTINQSPPSNTNNIKFNNNLSTSITWINSTHFKAQVPKGIGYVTTSITVGGFRSDYSYPGGYYPTHLNYDIPIITTKQYLGRNEDLITITGYNFVPQGIDPNQSTAIDIGYEGGSFVQIGGQPCQFVNWINSNQIIVKVPPGNGNSLSIDVNILGFQSAPNTYFSYYDECDFVCDQETLNEIEEIKLNNKADLKSVLVLMGSCLNQFPVYSSFEDIQQYIIDRWVEESITNNYKTSQFYNYFNSASSKQSFQLLSKYFDHSNTISDACTFNPNRKIYSLFDLVNISADIFKFILSSQQIQSNIKQYSNNFATYYYPSPKTTEDNFGLSIVLVNNRICSFVESSYQDFSSGKVLESCPLGPIVDQVINPTITTPNGQYSITVKGRLFNNSTLIKIQDDECIINYQNIQTDSITNIQTLTCLIPFSQDLIYSSSPISIFNQYTKNYQENLYSIFNDQHFFNYPIPKVNEIIYPNYNDSSVDIGSIIYVVGSNFFPNGVNNQNINKIKVKVGDIDLSNTISDFSNENGIDSFTIKANVDSSLNYLSFYYLNDLNMEIAQDADIDFSISRPFITRLSPSSGVYNDIITIYGGGFIRDKTKVSFSLEMSELVEWVSNNEIKVSVPHGYFSAFITIESGKDNVNLQDIEFRYAVPTIDRVIYKPLVNTSVSDTLDSIVIVGRGLGSYVNEIPYVYIDMNDYDTFCYPFFCTRPIVNENEEICNYLEQDNYPHYQEYIDIYYCNFPSNIGKNHRIDIETIDEFGYPYNKTHYFSYYEPYIERVSLLNSSTDGGINITIDGYNFPPFETVLTPHHEDWFEKSNVTFGLNYTLCTLIEFINSTQINCTVPPGIGKDHQIIISIDKQNSTQEISFSYNPPQINITASNDNSNSNSNDSNDNKAQFKSSTDGKDKFIIGGLNFIPEVLSNYYNDDENQDKEVNSIKLGEEYCEIIEWINSTTASCKPKPGIGKEFLVQVIIGTQISNEKVYFSYNKPVLSDSKYTAPTNGKEEITIKGENFIPTELLNKQDEGSTNNNEINPDENYIMIGDEKCNDIKWIDSTSASCKPKPGVGKDFKVSITIGGQTSTEENVLFSYDKPVLSNDINYEGSTDGSTIIELIGENFVPSELAASYNEIQNTDNNIQINSYDCLTIEWIDSTRAKCRVPSGQSKDLEIKVIVEKQETDTNQLFSYYPPTIESISPNRYRSNSDDIIKVTISGRDFGVENQKVSIGDNDCSQVEFNKDKTLICNLPKSNKVGKEIVKVEVGNQESNLDILFDYYGKPFISSVENPSSFASFEGGDQITIIGGNFIENGIEVDDIKVLFNQEEAIIQGTVSNEHIIISTLKGYKSNIPIQIELNSQSSNIDTSFSYSAPSISNVSPSKGKYNVNTPISINGDNIGFVGKEDLLSIKIGLLGCNDIRVSSSNLISCTVPSVSKEEVGTKELTLVFNSKHTKSEYTYEDDDSSSSDSSIDSGDDSTSSTTSETSTATGGGGPGVITIVPTVVSTIFPTTGANPSTTGANPSTTGANPSTTGANPSTTGANPSTTGINPSTTGANPSTNPSTTGANPSTTGANPSTTGVNPSTTGINPSTTGINPSTTGAITTGPIISGGSSSDDSSNSSSSGGSGSSSSSSSSSSNDSISSSSASSSQPNDNVKCLYDPIDTTLTFNNPNNQIITCIDSNSFSNSFNSDFSCTNTSSNTIECSNSINQDIIAFQGSINCYLDSQEIFGCSLGSLEGVTEIFDLTNQKLECQYDSDSNSLIIENNHKQFIFCNKGDDYYYKFEFRQTVICSQSTDPETSLESVSCSMPDNPDYIVYFDQSVRCYIDDKTSCFMNIK